MKIFVDENIPQGREAFEAHGEVSLFAGRDLKKADLLDVQALIVRSITKVNAQLLSGTQVRFVATATIGTDHVDLPYLSENGIGFASAPGCNSNSVGEYICTALCILETRRGFSLEGKTLGIIGYGHVGKNLAVKAKAIGLNVLLFDPPLRDLARQKGMDDTLFSELETLLSKCDILSFHVPLVKAGPYPTLGMVNVDFINKLEKPIVLLNSCRGEVILEPALLHGLQTGKISHLVLDVFNREPNINSDLCAKTHIVTPHIAGYSLQGKMNGTTQVLNSFLNHFGFTSPWKATYPDPAHQQIEYSSLDSVGNPFSDSQFRAFCLLHAYPILEDDARLRHSLESSEAGENFDKLRRDYPVRHEFTQYRIVGLPNEKRDLGSQLLSLGFLID